MSKFEKDVRKALIDKDWTMSTLALELGICGSYLYEILRDTQRGKNRRKQICELLNLNPKNYIGG